MTEVTLTANSLTASISEVRDGYKMIGTVYCALGAGLDPIRGETRRLPSALMADGQPDKSKRKQVRFWTRDERVAHLNGEIFSEKKALLVAVVWAADIVVQAAKAVAKGPQCLICQRTSGVQFAVIAPRFQPFGSVCVDCEADDRLRLATVDMARRIRAAAEVAGSLSDEQAEQVLARLKATT